MTDKNKQNNYSANRTEMPITPLTGDMLNTQIETGCYQVELKHEDVVAAGLPLTVCAKEHYIIGYLFVSELGSRGTLQSDRVIGQTLLLNGCKGNSPVIYRRQGNCPKGATKWEKWNRVIDEVELKAELKKHSNELKDQMVIPVAWGSASHIDRYVTAGIYSITGERLNLGDGLPIANSNPGHTIHARLMVLDSSIGGTGDAHDKCITQVLMLSNRTGGDGDVYIRTGRAASKGHLSGGTGWEQWGKLQQNVEVGQVNSLDSYIGNGIYSGVYTNGSTFFETFVMVVINNYAVAGVTGQVRNISQFKYALNLDGTFSYKTRRGHGNDSIEWGEWVDLGAADTTDIQDGAITAQKLSTDVRDKVEKVPVLEESATKEKTALVNGDTIVGLAREVYSRQGKVDTATFLKRTTAGGTSVSDGIATLKQIGGNIVKNLVDVDTVISNRASYIVNNNIGKITTDGSAGYGCLIGQEILNKGHLYYAALKAYNVDATRLALSVDSGNKPVYSYFVNQWITISMLKAVEYDTAHFDARILNETSATAYIKDLLCIDLTEMFGVGNEPTKEECDKIFGTIDAIPKGLTVAQPTGLKSIGYNQWNPDNVLEYKSVSAGTIIGVSGSHIAVIECLPCNTGTGENNGYIIGYGEGDTWSDEGIEVYLTPLNPLEVEGELYMHKLEKDATYGTYVPQIKGYLLVVTPTTDKFCAHFHWSGDRAATDYEPYIESSVALPVIPEMSEWGLAGIINRVQDTIDLDRHVYTKCIDCLDLGNINYQYYSPSETYPYGFFATSIKNARFSKTNALMCEKYTHGSFAVDKAIMANTANNGTFYIIDGSYTDAVSLKNALEGVKLYYEIIPQEYPIVTKAAPNYIGSDYGVEEFTGSKVPLAANILFYMRSLVSETRNFLDRLMAGLGTSDATAVADKIIAAVNQHSDVAETEEVVE